MNADPLLRRARELWQTLAGAPVSFHPDGGLSIVVSPDSLLCPRGWAGIIVIGDAAIATAPTDAAARVLRPLGDAPVELLTDPDELRAHIAIAEVLGPASLAYLSPDDFRPAAGEAAEPLPPDHADIDALLSGVGAADADESGLNEITSPAFVVRSDANVVAAAGYRTWPGETAHVCVLTALEHRGRGLARLVASAAVTHALAAGLLPQWRARPEESRRVGAALGFRRLGAQVSLCLGENGDRSRPSTVA